MPPARRNTQKDSLAGPASDRVRAIIEAAETTAAQIRAAAEEEAERIRGEARREAEAMLNTLRSGVERLAHELGVQPGNPSATNAVARDRTVEVAPVEAPAAPSADGVGGDGDIELAEDAAVGLDESQGGSEAGPASGGADDADREGARLVALNMALDGASRPDVDRYLQQNFDLGDRGALLDEVYASIGR